MQLATKRRVSVLHSDLVEHVPEVLSLLRAHVADGLRPPPRLTVAEYSDQFREIPPEGASEPGRWRTSRFPFLRRIMDLLSAGCPTQHVTVIKGAQLGFTETAVNFICYAIDHAPAPTLFVQKTIENVRRFSKQRLEKSFRLMPSISAKIGKQKSRDAQNTTYMKSFPGGVLVMGGANSAASLRSMPIQYLVLDEEDSYVQDLEGEGSPSELAIRRTANFPRRKIFRISTPAIKETSSIEPAFESGSRERYYVPCPVCNHMQVLWWPQMKWDGDDPSTVRYECVACKAPISEHSKTRMLDLGEWRAEDPDNPHKSFHISALYSPLGFFSWTEAAEIFIRATRTFDKSLLKVFVNTVLGETWTEAGRSIEAAWVRKRKEPYAKPVPASALLLTAGFDVQEDRIEGEVVGWGKNLENWSIDYTTIMGDTEHDFVWDQLDMYLMRTWEHTSGAQVPIAAAAIDSGHRAKRVYDFCRLREFRRVFAVKGDDGFGKGYLRRPVHRNDHGIWLFTLFVDEVKSKIYSQLQIDEPGPGFCHFPDRPEYSEDHFRGLTAERLATVTRGGRRGLRWELPKGRRNEQLDARAYAFGAFCVLNPNMDHIAAQGRPIMPATQRAARRGGRTLSKGI